MPIALMPSGQTRLVERTLEVSVALGSPETKKAIEEAVRQSLAGDQRQLSIRVQGGGGFGPWTFWIVWGSGSDKKTTPPVLIPDAEHSAEAVVSRIRAELSRLEQPPA